MTTSVLADRSRITIAGTEDGRRYLVTEEAGGWFVQPDPGTRPEPSGLTGEEMAKRWRQRTQLPVDLAEESLAAIRAAERVEREPA